MSVQLSRRARAIQPSVTFALSTRAKELKAEGKPVLDLTLGEPDLPTPAPVVEAAHRALDEGHFHYTPTAGVPQLRRRIAETYTQRLGLPIEASMTIATQGAKQALYDALATAADPGIGFSCSLPIGSPTSSRRTRSSLSRSRCRVPPSPAIDPSSVF